MCESEVQSHTTTTNSKLIKSLFVADILNVLRIIIHLLLLIFMGGGTIVL